MYCSTDILIFGIYDQWQQCAAAALFDRIVDIRYLQNTKRTALFTAN